MIDLIALNINLLHNPIGTRALFQREDSTCQTVKNYSEKLRLYPGAAPIYVTSENNGQSITIRCCPAKVLQGHNIFGSDHVVQLGFTLIRIVLERYKIDATSEQMEQWGQGQFRLDELHITRQFEVESYGLVKQTIEHLLRNTSTCFRAAFLKKGIGLELVIGESGVTLVMYDKRLEFDDKRKRERKTLAPFVGKGEKRKAGIKRIRKQASRGIRSELKLNKKYLKRHGLNIGSAWTPALAKEIYLKELALLRLGKVPSMKRASKLMDRLSDKKLKQTLFCWLNGGDLGTLHSRQTLANRRKDILRELEIDIVKDRVPARRPPVRLADIFHQDNMLPNFPEWTEEYPNLAYRPKKDLVIPLPCSLPERTNVAPIKAIPKAASLVSVRVSTKNAKHVDDRL